jgi:Zn-dependent protease with chaperone function
MDGRSTGRAGKQARLLVGLIAVLGGCTTHPITGRDQLLFMPALQAAQADLGFALSAAADGAAPFPPCAPLSTEQGPADSRLACPGAEELARFTRQVERIGAELATEARSFAPELFTRVKALDIAVRREAGGGTGSSAGGRVVLAPELAGLDPTDDVVAFLIAREIGHVIARHGEEDAGAQVLASAISSLVPGGSLIVKLAVSMAGSRVLTTSWAEQQRREADGLALALLERTQRSADVIALNLRCGLKREHLPAGAWRAHLLESTQYVASAATLRPESVLALGRNPAPAAAPEQVFVALDGPVEAVNGIRSFSRKF